MTSTLSRESIQDAQKQQQRQRERQREEREDESISLHHDKQNNGADDNALVAAAVADATAQNFFLDGQHCILEFLSLDELPKIAILSKHWYNAVCSEPSRSLPNIKHVTSYHFPQLIISPLSSHIGELDMMASSRDSMTLSELMMLKQLENLIKLSFRMDVDDLCRTCAASNAGNGMARFIANMFPDVLDLHMRLDSVDEDEDEQQQQSIWPLIKALSLKQDLVDLTLEIENGSLFIDISPLASLPHLESLTLLGWVLNEATFMEVSKIRTLYSLDINHGSQWTDAHFECLTNPEHCKLEELTKIQLRDAELSSNAIHALSRLAALHSMRACVREDALPHLSKLCHLKSLDISTPLDDYEEFNEASIVLPHLKGFDQLQMLDVSRFSVTEEDLRVLANTLPNLSNLSIQFGHVTTLDPLNTLTNLSHLSVWNCQEFKLDHLITAASCKSVRKLSCDLSLNEHKLAEYILSTHPDFQHLEEFVITDIEEDGEE